jgi:hypothetical protein
LGEITPRFFSQEVWSVGVESQKMLAAVQRLTPRTRKDRDMGAADGLLLFAGRHREHLAWSAGAKFAAGRQRAPGA